MLGPTISASARRRSATSICRSCGPPSCARGALERRAPVERGNHDAADHGRLLGRARSRRPDRRRVTAARSGQMRSRLKARRSYQPGIGSARRWTSATSPLRRSSRPWAGRCSRSASSCPGTCRTRTTANANVNGARARLGLGRALDPALAAPRGGGRADRPALHRRPRPRAVVAARRDDGGHRDHRLRPVVYIGIIDRPGEPPSEI